MARPLILFVGGRIRGAFRARPKREFVELPPLLEKTITLLKMPSPGGVKLMTRFDEPDGVTSYGVPDRIPKAPGEIAADPLRVPAPALLTTSIAWTMAPVETKPKS